MDQNCGNSQRQFVRRRWKLRNTWIAAYQAANIEKSEAMARRLARA